ncbi:unnamed protein product, partial [Medioppia subpectinata]
MLVIMSALIVVFGIVQPLCTELWQFYLCAMLVNAGVSSFDMGTTVWVIEMWQKNSAPVLQLAKAVGGAGMVVAPLLAGPFIQGRVVPSNATLAEFFNRTHSKAKGDDLIDEYNYSLDRRSDLLIPFIAGGAVNLIIPVSMLAMFIFKRYHYDESEAELNSQVGGGKGAESRRATVISVKEFTIRKPTVEQTPAMKWLFVALIGISLSTYGAMENTHLVYSSTYYQLGPIKMSASKAADVNAVLNASLTVGKLISTFIALKVKANIMLIYHMVLLAISQAVLYFGRNSEVIVWVGNVLI